MCKNQNLYEEGCVVFNNGGERKGAPPFFDQVGFTLTVSSVFPEVLYLTSHLYCWNTSKNSYSIDYTCLWRSPYAGLFVSQLMLD